MVIRIVVRSAGGEGSTMIRPVLVSCSPAVWLERGLVRQGPMSHAPGRHAAARRGKLLQPGGGLGQCLPTHGDFTQRATECISGASCSILGVAQVAHAFVHGDQGAFLLTRAVTETASGCVLLGSADEVKCWSCAHSIPGHIDLISVDPGRRHAPRNGDSCLLCGRSHEAVHRGGRPGPGADPAR